VQIELDGGTIWIDWREDGVWMTGATEHVMSGSFSTAFLERAQ
jgi:diaminopimelate epimerase